MFIYLVGFEMQCAIMHSITESKPDYVEFTRLIGSILTMLQECYVNVSNGTTLQIRL